MARIAHIIKVTRIAGAETHLLALVDGLRRTDDVEIILLVEPSKPMNEFAPPLPVHRVVIYHDLDITLIPRLQRRLRDIRPDIVHTHLFHADLYGIPAARLAGVPVVISSRHNENRFRRRTPIRQINGVLWALTDAIIAISDSTARFVVEVEGVKAEKVRTIRYGLPYTPKSPVEQQQMRADARRELGMDTDAVIIGVVCRLVEQKGVIYGLRAFSEIAKRYPQACMVIVGDGPLRRTIQAEILPMGLQGRVRFLGWRQDASHLMAGFDLLLLPSLWEGFGLVILEAMAQAVPVVASRISAIPEIVVDGETGLLFPPRDTAALSEALARLAGDHALRRYMGMMAQERLEEHFTAERMVNETSALYHLLLEKKKP